MLSCVVAILSTIVVKNSFDLCSVHALLYYLQNSHLLNINQCEPNIFIIHLSALPVVHSSAQLLPIDCSQFDNMKILAVPEYCGGICGRFRESL